MKIHDLKDVAGRVYAFEVENDSLDRNALFKFVESIPGVRVTKAPKFFSDLVEEVFCEFEIGGRTFIAWEPFGDNSRYWIGPEPPAFCEQVAIVRNTFANADNH